MTETHPTIKRLTGINRDLEKALVDAKADAEICGSDEVFVDGETVSLTVKRLKEIIFEMQSGIEETLDTINHDSPPRLAHILSAVSTAFEVPEIVMRASTKVRGATYARFAFCHLAKHVYPENGNKLAVNSKSLNQIGFMIGRRDHTTVIHALKKAEVLLETDPIFAANVRLAISLLLSKTGISETVNV